jgi:endonuclease YncB( thermonuclease family)
MTWTFEDVLVERVVDGDTYVISFQPTPEDDTKRRKLRLFGVNTPEKNHPDTKEAGYRAMNYVIPILEGKKVTIYAHGIDSFGRWLCDVIIDGMNLGAKLLENNLAVIYKRQ